MADSTLLLSTLVFKGKQNGCIATKEFPSGNYPTTHFNKCQDSAWMDKEVMIAWVNEVLAPYVAAAPDHPPDYATSLPEPPILLVVAADVAVEHVVRLCLRLCCILLVIFCSM